MYFEILKIASKLKKKKRVVIGTTGFNKKQRKFNKNLRKKNSNFKSRKYEFRYQFVDVSY